MYFPRSLSVVPFEARINGLYQIVGYHLCALLSLDMGETFESIYHPAIFVTKASAQAFLSTIRGRQIDTKNWMLPTSEARTYYLRREEGSENPAPYSPIRQTTIKNAFAMLTRHMPIMRAIAKLAEDMQIPPYFIAEELGLAQFFRERHQNNA